MFVVGSITFRFADVCLRYYNPLVALWFEAETSEREKAPWFCSSKLPRGERYYEADREMYGESCQFPEIESVIYEMTKNHVARFRAMA
jgi:hypothetical protein